MPAIFNQSEPIAVYRETTVQLKDTNGNPFNGFTLGGGATLKIAKAGANLGASAGGTITQITGGADTDGLYRLRLAAADLDTIGDLQYEIAQIGTILTTVGFVTIQVPRAIRYQLAQGGDASHIQLDAGASAVDNEYAGSGLDCTVKIVSGTGSGQTRIGVSYVGATKTLAIAPNWNTNPDATSVYEIQPFTGKSATISTVSGNVSGNVGGNVTGNVNGSVIGNVNGSIGSVAANGISSASLAASALTAVVNSIMGAAVESGLTLAHALQGIFAQAAGRVSGFATNSPKYRDFLNTKDRITGSVSTDGRTSVTFNFD